MSGTVNGGCKCGSAWLSQLHSQKAIRERYLALPRSATSAENDVAAVAVAAAPNWPQAWPASPRVPAMAGPAVLGGSRAIDRQKCATFLTNRRPLLVLSDIRSGGRTQYRRRLRR